MFILAIVSSACGLDAFFYFPERYIERSLQRTELVGRYELTKDSEIEITAFLQKHPSWKNWGYPWKTITLNDNRTCQIELKDTWVKNSEQLFYQAHAENNLRCEWQLQDISGFAAQGGTKDVPGIELRFDHGVSFTYFYSLYIVEENSTLILWDYIGDPDSLDYQDFKQRQS